MNKFTESFISSIVKNVKKECLMNGAVIPTDRLVLSLFKLLALNPKFSNELQTTGKETANSFVKFMVKFLKKPDHPSVATLNIQIYLSQNRVDDEFILNKRNENLERSTRPLLNLIYEKRQVKTREDSDQLYHHVSCYIILLNGAGDPTDDGILKETIAALKSVLSFKELARFASKPIYFKEKQLQDVFRIVTGIYIFNTDSKKTVDMNYLPSILETALQKCYNHLECKLREIEERTSSFIYLFSEVHIDVNVKEQRLITDEGLDDEYCEAEHYLKSYIIFLQQLGVYLRMLMQKNNLLSEEFQLCMVQLQHHLQRVRKTVKFRTAIPVVEIYPQFKDISLSWDKMQTFSTLLSNLTHLMSYLREMYEKIPEPPVHFISDKLKYSIKPGPFPKIKDVTVLANLNCDRVMPDDHPDFYKVEAQYAGFCIVTFVETGGVLALGIKEYGLIKYQNSYYCFSSLDSMNKFCQTPETFIEKTEELVFLWPETINLLRLEKYFESDRCKTSTKRQIEHHRVKDVEVQTDVHPIPAYKDHGYVSSIWQLKKSVIHQAEIRKYRTHSVQTDVSNFRRNTSVQTRMSTKSKEQ